MSDQPTPPDPRREGGGGPHLDAGGDVSVGGDVAGHDVVKQTVTNVGFSEQAVLRLVLVVGALVFVTAACFFSGGLVVGAAALTALDRPLNSSPEAAQSFQQKLNDMRAQPVGQPQALRFSETEISSYVKFILGPQIGFTNETGRARLITDPASGAPEIVVAGQLQDAGGLPVVATFQLTRTTGQPLALQAAMARVVQVPGTSFGAVAVPGAVLQPVSDQLNGLLGNVQILDANSISADPSNQVWELNVVTH